MHLSPLGASLTLIKNKKGPRLEPCNQYLGINIVQDEFPFKRNFCFVSSKKYLNTSIKSP